MQLSPDVQAVFEKFSDQDKSIIDRLVDLVTQVEPGFQNRIQWGVPTFTLHDNWHHWIFSLRKTKAGVTVLFHKGWLLADPQAALTGEGAHGRMLRFNCVEE